MEIRGTGGSLQVGYHRAATVGAWTVQMDRGGDEAVIALMLRDRDAFWIAQSPLDVRLALGDRSWTWRTVTRRTTDPCVVIGSGPPESTR